MAKILFILMPQFKDPEFTTPYKILTDAGHVVDVAGLKQGEIVGADGHKQSPNLDFQQLTSDELDKYDALVIPGGPGSTKYLWDNNEIQEAIKYFHEKHKLIAAICYAVIAIVQTGILKNKHATVYPTDEAKAILEEHGVRFSKDGCVALADEKIITAQGPSQAEKFGQAIKSFLS